LCKISLKSVKNCDRESADRHTDRQTHRDDTGDLIMIINVKKTTVLNTLVTMTMTSDVENSKN